MFKFARNSVGHFPADVTLDPSRRPPELADRRSLLDQISNFLLDHDLDVNPDNLALAQRIVSGRNPELSRQIVARQFANQPVTQDWLDGLTADADHGADHIFDAALQTGACAARMANEPLSVAFCDIDRFAAINDSHGRDAGDRVIQAVARVLQRIAGQNCQVARHGRADFAVLFRSLTLDEAADELNQARENFARRNLVDRQTHVAIGSVTFSGGIADALAYGDPQAALNAADEALGAAKERGRNCVVVAQKPDLEKSSPSGGGGSPQD